MKTPANLDSLIRTIRGQKVLIDADLARIYGVETKQENERMLTMTQTCDGFEIAQKDLLLRGPGDFIGSRQHGEDGAGLLAGAMDVKLLEEAARAAREILQRGGEESARLIELAAERYGTLLGDIAMN